jgi:hypothetical protein
MNTFTISFRDEGHLRAHVDHFLVPLETALGWARDELASRPERSGWSHFAFSCPEAVGVTGLVVLEEGPGGDFWARRRGRMLPSHLIVGEKVATTDLCVWGFWQDPASFVLHTLYPGRVAPREIHDPELSLKDLPGALDFWSRHAIVVAPGEWDE